MQQWICQPRQIGAEIRKHHHTSRRVAREEAGGARTMPVEYRRRCPFSCNAALGDDIFGRRVVVNRACRLDHDVLAIACATARDGTDNMIAPPLLTDDA